MHFWRALKTRKNTLRDHYETVLQLLTELLGSYMTTKIMQNNILINVFIAWILCQCSWTMFLTKTKENYESIIFMSLKMRFYSETNHTKVISNFFNSTVVELSLDLW